MRIADVAVKDVVVVMYDAPSDADFEAWLHGRHYREVEATPGVVSARRYEIMNASASRPDCKRYLAIIETADLDMTLAWRDSHDGQRSQAEADARGVDNRASFVCRLIRSGQLR
jgi:hypothetical protein